MKITYIVYQISPEQLQSFQVVRSLPHCSVHCRNSPMQEGDAKMLHRCQSLLNMQNIWSCVSTVHERSESTKIQRLEKNICHLMYRLYLILMVSLPVMPQDWSDLKSSQSTQQHHVLHILRMRRIRITLDDVVYLRRFTDCVQEANIILDD